MKTRHTFISVIVFGLTACSNRVSQEELIAAAITLRMDDWKKTQIQNCRDQAMERAERYVDSFLLANSLESKLDTISKPDKPVKPPKPMFKEKPDSLKVEEVFKEKK
jgi:hypothetical protein